MPRIFLSYRREDSIHVAGRLFDSLTYFYGPGAIIKDVDTLPAGSQYRVELRKLIVQSDVVLVLIAKNWLTASLNGKKRLHLPNDLVRQEIEIAIESKRPVIPLLLDGAKHPNALDLPMTIRLLHTFQSLTVGSDPNYHRDVDRLISHINLHLGQKSVHPHKRRAPAGRPSRFVSCLVLTLVAFVSFLLGIVAAFVLAFLLTNEN